MAQVLPHESIWADLLGLEKNLEIFESVMEEAAERRKHRRFKVQLGAYAALGHRFSPIGQIMDISKGGLSFCYVASEERTNESTTLNILLTDRSFCMEKVPFMTTWDFPVPRDFSFGPVTLRHCGMRFGKVTRSQKLDLEYFIRNHTTDELEH